MQANQNRNLGSFNFEFTLLFASLTNPVSLRRGQKCTQVQDSVLSSAGCLVRSRHPRLKNSLIALHQRQPQLDVVLGPQYNLFRSLTRTRVSLRASKEEPNSKLLPSLALYQPYLSPPVSALILVPPKIQFLLPF